MELKREQARLASAARAYHESQEMSELAERDPRAFLEAHGILDILDSGPRLEGMEIRIHANKPHVWYLPMPPDPNRELSEEDLAHAVGGRDPRHQEMTVWSGVFACSTAPSTVGKTSDAS